MTTRDFAIDVWLETQRLGYELTFEGVLERVMRMLNAAADAEYHPNRLNDAYNTAKTIRQ